MAIRGVYTESEKKMIANFNKGADALCGWAKSLPRRVATEESIKNMAQAVDEWNPLWRDNDYAMTTRWGGIIAPPLYQDFVSALHFVLEPTPDLGFPMHQYLGEDWQIFRPIRANDTFKVWRRRPQLEDITTPDGRGPRKFKFMAHDLDHINQRDEVVSTFRLYLEYTFLPGPPKKVLSMPEYIYSKEELAYIDRMIDKEKVRGGNIRYWEDVKIGEETAPVALGPTTVWDMIKLITGGHEFSVPSMREIRRNMPWELILDPVTGVTHHVVEWHLSDHVAQILGEPRAFHFGVLARQLMARLVTNWMGDDGLLKRFNWRHLTRTVHGDTLIGRGRVTGKRIENGEHLVDLSVWLENIRGNITEAAVATVSLFSRESLQANKGPAADSPAAATGKNKTAKFGFGDKVRIKDRADWPKPPGYRMAGTEGTVVKFCEWMDVYDEFPDYAFVEIQKNKTNENIGAVLVFRTEFLEKI